MVKAFQGCGWLRLELLSQVKIIRILPGTGKIPLAEGWMQRYTYIVCQGLHGSIGLSCSVREAHSGCACIKYLGAYLDNSKPAR